MMRRRNNSTWTFSGLKLSESCAGIEGQIAEAITLNKLGVDNKLHLENGYILQSNQSPEKLKK
jgi:hypothetical protein